MQGNGLKNLIFYLLVFYQRVSNISSEETEFEEDFQQPCSTVVLIPSNKGLKYMKSKNLDGSYNVTYDCALGTQSGGTVELLDASHPDTVASILIQNCENITMEMGNSIRTRGWYDIFLSEPLKKFKELKIINIKELTFSESQHFYNADPALFINDYNKINIDINGVKFLKIESLPFRSLTANDTVIMKIKDVKIAKIKEGALKSRVTELYIEKVQEGIIKNNSIFLNNQKAVLEIKNSNLDIQNTGSLVFQGSQVVMFNNSFQNLRSSSIEAKKSFTFEKNNVKNMVDSFKIISPNVQIVSNNFDVIETPWLSDILFPNNGKLSVLNVTKNTMNYLPPGFFSINPHSRPDVIILKRNSFYCSCKYWNLVNTNEHYNGNIAQNIILHENGQNLCVNLGDCPIHKVLNHMTELCMDEFVCDHEKKSDGFLGTHLTSISSILNNIADKLDVLIKESYSSKKNLPMTEQSIIT